MFRKLNVPILGIVENMSYLDVPGSERLYPFGHGGARRKAETLNVPFLGEVPMVISLRERGDEGKLGEVFKVDTAARAPLFAVVENMAAQISIQNLKAPKFPKLEILN